MSDETVRFAAASAPNGTISIFDNIGLYGRSDQLRVYSLPDAEAYPVLREATGLHLSSTPAVVFLENGERHIIGESDKQLWHFGPSPQEKLPDGVFAFNPTVCSMGGGRLDVLMAGSDHQLYHSYQDKTGGHWESWFTNAVPKLPNGLKSAPSATSSGPGRMDVVALGADDAVWHLRFDYGLGGWQPWRSLGGKAWAAPTICSLQPGRLDVFVRGISSLWHKYWSGGAWHSPNNAAIDDWADEVGKTAPQLRSAPVAVTRFNREIYVLVVGYGEVVWHTRWDGSKWSAWIETKSDVTYPHH